ncbi:unnamed protein product [Hydatigera taeniaeformis]|uniref:Uncharacterized protein n=1 Tax=Hydatigena taeniaeformis TaxID=6205 RepID=A0A0R3X0K8_HYDTA|nr:unnamed protein product [Hydatigera taeniaeformis]
MFFHPRRKTRLIYAVCCILMFICIICMLSITITNYLSHKTVFRVDQIGLTEGIQPPSITICLDEHRTYRVHARRLSIPPLRNWSILKGVDLPCQAKGEMTWSSRLHSVSAYIAAVAHFNVTFDTSPPGSLSLSVTEQVPIPPDEVCTTFKLNHSCRSEHEFWKIWQTFLMFGKYMGRERLTWQTKVEAWLIVAMKRGSGGYTPLEDGHA